MERLSLTRPLILAPMAGGVGTPALVAAVSRAGALGSLGAAYLSPAQIAKDVAEVRRLTHRPFAVNLFAPQPLPEVTPHQIGRAAAELAPFHVHLKLPPPSLPDAVQQDFGAQFGAVLEARPSVFSFAFGRLERGYLEALRERNILCIGTATSVPEARLLEEDGVDAVVVQGGAAGGHRGGWLQDELAPTLELVRRAAQVVRLPLIAAGGLMTRGDVQDVLDAGAELAQCGTAFLRATEAGTPGAYREALAGATGTTLTRNFSGRLARGLPNAITAGLHAPLPYPYQNALTRPLRAAAATTGRADCLSLWAGEGFRQSRDGPAAGILEELWP
ncbi:2-nitropropane dioxygenase [Deinococcus koreensis]|uniref:Propionate 3-nitronate monooxygenase n=2 Tax=Deinococcus koreensis TaxID=2054903 RepID=A0A2K3V1P5_9DEIO|nr:2-nitropropane dioxygenase [Deinococcus koreensis]